MDYNLRYILNTTKSRLKASHRNKFCTGKCYVQECKTQNPQYVVQLKVLLSSSSFGRQKDMFLFSS